MLRERGENADSILALCSLLREKSVKVHSNLPYLVDNCGTGGDNKNTFNISTVSALIAAGAGAHVAKHGNRSASSQCGSADLLESLGVRIDAKTERMLEALEKTGFGYFHAPIYHPVLKNVQKLRKSIQGRTIFNLAAPLLNPLRIKRQVIGVPSRNFLKPIAESLISLKTQHSFIITGEDETDEITPFGITRGFEVKGSRIQAFRLNPKRFDMNHGKPEELTGGSLNQNKKIAIELLENKRDGSKKNTVLLNAGLTLCASGRAHRIEEGIERAKASLESGSALSVLKKLIAISNR